MFGFARVLGFGFCDMTFCWVIVVDLVFLEFGGGCFFLGLVGRDFGRFVLCVGVVRFLGLWGCGLLATIGFGWVCYGNLSFGVLLFDWLVYFLGWVCVFAELCWVLCVAFYVWERG